MLSDQSDADRKRTSTVEGTLLASNLGFPEGPVVMPDGSIVFCDGNTGELLRWDGDSMGTFAATRAARRGAPCSDPTAPSTSRRAGTCPGSPDQSAVAGIQRVNADGSVEMLSTEIGGHALAGPNDLAFGPDGRLWFTDSGTEQDDRFAPDERAPGRLFVLGSGGAGEFLMERPNVYPNGIAFDAQGRLYWTESAAHRVCRLDDGQATTFCQLSDGHVPDGMAFAADGRRVRVHDDLRRAHRALGRRRGARGDLASASTPRTASSTARRSTSPRRRSPRSTPTSAPARSGASRPTHRGRCRSCPAGCSGSNHRGQAPSAGQAHGLTDRRPPFTETLVPDPRFHAAPTRRDRGSVRGLTPRGPPSSEPSTSHVRHKLRTRTDAGSDPGSGLSRRRRRSARRSRSPARRPARPGACRARPRGEHGMAAWPPPATASRKCATDARRGSVTPAESTSAPCERPCTRPGPARSSRSATLGGHDVERVRGRLLRLRPAERDDPEPAAREAHDEGDGVVHVRRPGGRRRQEPAGRRRLHLRDRPGDGPLQVDVVACRARSRTAAALRARPRTTRPAALGRARGCGPRAGPALRRPARRGRGRAGRGCATGSRRRRRTPLARQAATIASPSASRCGRAASRGRRGSPRASAAAAGPRWCRRRRAHPDRRRAPRAREHLLPVGRTPRAPARPGDRLRHGGVRRRRRGDSSTSGGCVDRGHVAAGDPAAADDPGAQRHQPAAAARAAPCRTCPARGRSRARRPPRRAGRRDRRSRSQRPSRARGTIRRPNCCTRCAFSSSGRVRSVVRDQVRRAGSSGRAGRPAPRRPGVRRPRSRLPPRASASRFSAMCTAPTSSRITSAPPSSRTCANASSAPSAVAPSSATRGRSSAVRTFATTRAPRHAPICTAAVPTPPLAPFTSRVVAGREAGLQADRVERGQERLAARRRRLRRRAHRGPRPARARWAARARPGRRRRRGRTPGRRRRSARHPLAARDDRPGHLEPGHVGRRPRRATGCVPSRWSTSAGFTPANGGAITTSNRPGAGSGRSSTATTSRPPDPVIDDAPHAGG